MDQRRFVIWVLATTLCLLLYLQLSPPPPRENAADADAKVAKKAEKEGEIKPVPPLRLEPRRRTTLGSMRPEDGFHLLVTLSNKGAAIERIELTERDVKGNLRYHRTDVHHGYLGYLAPSLALDAPGAEVNVVGPGTPAALAKSTNTSLIGLRPGDVISALNAATVDSPLTLDRLLEKTHPGDEIELTVLRPDQAEPKKLSEEKKSENSEEEKKSDDASSVAALPEIKRQELSFRTVLTEHPLDLIRLSSDGGEEEIAANQDRLSCLMTLAKLGNREIQVGKQELEGVPSQYESIWRGPVALKPDTELSPSDLAEFHLPFSEADEANQLPLELVRRYRLRKADDESTEGYAIDLESECVNQSDKPQEVALRLNGPNGITLEGWWFMTKISPHWWDGAGARDVVFNSVARGHNLHSVDKIRKHIVDHPNDPELAIVTEKEPPDTHTFRYLAVDGQYFSTGFIPHEDDGATLEAEHSSAYLVADPTYKEKSKYHALNVSFLMDTPSFTAPPNASAPIQRLRLFAGPKRPDLLNKVHMDQVIEYGFFPWVAIPLSKILHGFHWLFSNYAIAIVLLTVVVRALMFPLGRKAAINAQKMQELAPELKKINEKYKDDLQKRMDAQRELQRRVGFNPLSGCLPLFIQIPIFIGLYRCLSVDIELRQAPLWRGLSWCSNLAAPDQIANWQSWLPDFIAGRGSGWLGPYFNILPVVVVVLFLVQQKLFMPPATDEQTLMTQKIMNFMTIFMGIFFFKVPSGLCIYFITSSLWSIAERKLVKKTIPQSAISLAGSGGGKGIVVDAAKAAAKSSQIEETRKRRKKLNRP